MIFTSMTESAEYLSSLQNILRSAKSDKQIFQAVVDAPFINKRIATIFGLGFITFLLNNKETGFIERVKKTENELGKLGSEISVKPFKSIKVPINYRGNIIAEAVRSGRYQQTSDWAYILAPDLSPVESRLNQANSGISCSFVYPFDARGGGALIFHYFITVDKITSEHRNFMHRYAKLVGQALSNRL